MGYSVEELIQRREEEELKKLKEEFLVYHEKLLDRDFLLIYPDMLIKQLSRLKEDKKQRLNNLKFIEIQFRKENFAHLVGVPKEGRKGTAEEFYNSLIKDEILRKDYTTTIFSQLKGDVFNKMPQIFRQMTIIGDYNQIKPKFESDKIVGGTKKVPDVVLGIKNITLNVSKMVNLDKYVPASLLKEMAEDLIIENSKRKIIYVFEKRKTEEKYSKLNFVHKDFTHHSIYHNKECFEFCSLELKDEIKQKIGVVEESK